MVEVLDTFKKFKCTDMTPKGRIAVLHQQLIRTIQHPMSERLPQCVTPSQSGHHETQTLHSLQNQPEVFVLNLQWSGEPSPEECMKILVSIPDSFHTK